MTQEEKLDYCYECSGLGDDYYIDDNGESVCVCDSCFIRMDEDNEC